MKRVLTMFAVSAAALCAAAPAGWAQNPQAVLSWGTCPPAVRNMDFSTPAGPYVLVVAAQNLTAADANFGNDLNLFIGPNLPDAWNFDDAGCQTTSQIGAANTPVSKSCPILKGANSLVITNFSYNAAQFGGRLTMRLAITHDTFTPVAGTVYTMWQVTFNHAFSVAGPGDVDHCGNADLPVCITMSGTTDGGTPSVLLSATGIATPFQFANSLDQFVTWNSAAGCPASTPSLPSTWGKVKGLYR